jgi:septum formation protein
MAHMTPLVLGSASPGRLKVLRQAGIDPLVVVSGVDEDAVIATLGSDASPADVVRILAQAKADQVATRLDDAIAADCVVIGCDSMLYIDGRLVGKPASADAARSQWQSMGGRSGQLYTGHCLLRLLEGNPIQRVSESSSTTVHFANPTATDLEAYIGSGEPLAVAGGFTLDGLGGWFVDRIEGDPSNVIGLSLPLTATLLQRVGLSIAELWA